MNNEGNNFTNPQINNEFEKIIYLPDKCSYPNLIYVKSYLDMYLNKTVSLNDITNKITDNPAKIEKLITNVQKSEYII